MTVTQLELITFNNRIINTIIIMQLYKDSSKIIMAQLQSSTCIITITQFYLPIETIETIETIKAIETIKTIKSIRTTEITNTIDN